MPIPTPWMPLLIEQKWLTPKKIGTFSAAVPIIGSLLYMVSALTRYHNAQELVIIIGLLLLIPQLILYFFFQTAMQSPTAGAAIAHFLFRGSLAGAIYGVLAGLIFTRLEAIVFGFFFGLILGFAYTLVYLPILGWVVNISRTPAHDTPNRLLLALSLWLGVLVTILNSAGLVGFGGRLTWWPGQFLGLLLILIAVGRDLRLQRVLSQLYQNKLPGISLMPLTAPSSDEERELVPLISGDDAVYDGVVICKTTQNDGPFRSSESESPLALCPLDPTAGMKIIKQRIVWGLGGLAFIFYLLWVYRA